MQRREIDAALAQRQAAPLQRLGGRRQLEQHGRPQQDLHQQRRVAQQFHIAQRQAAHQRIDAAARQPDGHAQHRGADTGQHHQHHRVQRAGQDGVGDRVGRRVRQQRHADLEARGPLQEVEADRQPQPLQVIAQDEAAGDHQQRQRRAHRALPQLAAQGAGRLAAGAQRRRRHRRRIRHGVAHRNGGAYCRPPSVHSLFRPRGSLSGDFSPSERS
ncbi:hypothetical protein LMG26845_04798 [Achromobacter insuavis]|uniref:Uncharacterized protein n=1 Tax=Achromobacter insuavis TaxID=1287735 RepID=A0A6J5B4X6_9BURK|nr:hypothetical protein LMG26845_04798 [Achromobacter insuavis]CUI39875.1 Uncharacterised protein [Achromobacter sp. 2789STDY5608628]